MKLKIIILTIVGIIIALLGLLWFLQGAAIIQMCPILCFADCECMTGGSQFWEVTGTVTFIIGLVVTLICVKLFLKKSLGK
jgi:hypothetical protein